MDQNIIEMPGMDAALAQLDAMEKSDADTTAKPQTPPATSATLPAPAPPALKTEAQTPPPTPTDTPAAPDAAKTPKEGTTPEAAKTATEPPKPEDATKSRYAKSQERLTKTWEQVNAEKATLAAEKTKLETERAEIVRQKAEFETIKRSMTPKTPSADDYANAARAKQQQADALRTQADRAENAGDFQKAETLRKQATRAEVDAEGMSEAADRVRKNPPATFEGQKAQYDQARQAWTLEAAKAFPDLSKDGSELQQTVAGHLNALAKSDPQLLAHPSVIYHVTRLATAEARAKSLESEAARVPAMVKEAETLRARIKELEAMTTPAPGGATARLGAEPAQDGIEALRLEAAADPSAHLR